MVAGSHRTMAGPETPVRLAAGGDSRSLLPRTMAPSGLACTSVKRRSTPHSSPRQASDPPERKEVHSWLEPRVSLGSEDERYYRNLSENLLAQVDAAAVLGN